MKDDRLTIEILEDGTIKTTSDEVSAPNHDNAEQFLRAMARVAGGETTTDCARGCATTPSSRARQQGQTPASGALSRAQSSRKGNIGGSVNVHSNIQYFTSRKCSRSDTKSRLCKGPSRFLRQHQEDLKWWRRGEAN